MLPCLFVPETQRITVAEYIWNYAVDNGLIVRLGDQWVPWTMDAHDWGRLAQCESGGRWSLEGGAFSGGIQFLPSTWITQGGRDFAERPSQASAAEQIEVGRRLLDAAGPGQWPACSRRIGWR